MKKRLLFALVAFLGGLSLMGSGCAVVPEQEDHAQHDGELKIAATIFPLYDIARTVAGDDAHVTLITPPGASPHYFDASPSLIKKLQGSDFIFQIGAELDDWVVDLADNVPGAEVVDLSHDISLKKSSDTHLHEDGENRHGHEEDHEHEEDVHHEDHEEDMHAHEHEHEAEGEEAHDHAHGEFDPHYWLDPMIATDIAMHIAEELAHHDADHAAEYTARANEFAAEIAKKNAEWTDALQGISQRELVTFHDAFSYFAEHFGLEVVATFEPFAGQEPTAQYLAELKDEVMFHNIKTLFLEPQLPAKTIEQFAKDNGLAIGILDPVGGVDGRMTYIDLIDYNVRTIIETNT